jgi:DNA repair protein NreA
MMPDSLKFTGKDSRIKGLERIRLLEELSKSAKQTNMYYASRNEFSGKIPNVLIGDFGYPNVNAGFLSSAEYQTQDSPKEWKENPQVFSIKKIIELRQGLLNSKSNLNVRNFNERFADKLQEVGLSSKPVEAEINYEKKLTYSNTFDKEVLPHGPSAYLRNMKITENPKVPVLVEKFASDSDFKASRALINLSKAGIDEHYLTKVLSTGNLGVKEQRKIVPTKWSITAVDDTLGKELIAKIQHNESQGYELFFGGYLGNYYLALIFPGPWSFELFETYVGSGLEDAYNFLSSRDFEGALGRKDYAKETVGGYYASRLALLEYFHNHKKKGRVLLMRFISDEYWAPLGVWVVREASRNCFSSRSIKFESGELMQSYASRFLRMKFNIALEKFLQESILWKSMKTQRDLSNY